MTVKSRHLILHLSVVVLTATFSCRIMAQAKESDKEMQPTKAIVLGVGSPNINAERSGTSIGIMTNGTLYLFDAGPGVERRLAESRPKLAELKVQKFGTVFISHLHRDHTAGLAALLYYHNISSSFLARGDDLTVYGPSAEKGSRYGIADVISHFQAALIDPSIPLGTSLNDGPAVRAIEIHPGTIYKDSGIAVTAFEVEHKSPSAFGFRVQTADRVIVISGDTRASDKVIEACNGCDLLFHEVFGDRYGAAGPTGNAQGHTSAEELGEIARRAKPKHLVIYHDVQIGHGAGTDIIRKAFNGEVTFARDLEIY